MTIEIILITFLSIHILFYVGLILLFIFNFKSSQKKTEFQPNVSILISCRNEAKNIPALMDSLKRLEYPKDKLEILIANDESEDNTLDLLRTYESVNIQIYDLTNSLNGLKGKMNTLAQLFKKSKGDFIFLTDADSIVNPDWIQTLLNNWDEKIGLIAGYIDVRSNGLFSTLQNMDYTLGQGMMKIAADSCKPLFVSGNNMMISRQAYEATGGFDNMSQHLTEDVLLMTKIMKSGYQINTVINSESKVNTQPLVNISSILSQRTRWMEAFSLMPIWVKLFSILRLTYLPLTIWLIIISPIIGIGMLLLKTILNTVFFISINKKTKNQHNFVIGLLYDFYELIIYLPALVLHLFFKETTWKGRKF